MEINLFEFKEAYTANPPNFATSKEALLWYSTQLQKIDLGIIEIKNELAVAESDEKRSHLRQARSFLLSQRVMCTAKMNELRIAVGKEQSELRELRRKEFEENKAKAMAEKAKRQQHFLEVQEKQRKEKESRLLEKPYNIQLLEQILSELKLLNATMKSRKKVIS